LRAETVDILNTRAQSADVRDALVAALQHDQNAGVRMKALDGLKAFAQEPAVRSALAQVLLSDSNPGLRTQAIDLLTRGSSVDTQIIGTLQELMLRGEQQGYVRERCRRVLESMNASLETY
jgi:HEAT repeat protein